MDIKVTTLCENTATFGFLGEWGLSIHVEVDEFNILLDTGLSCSAINNAHLRNIDLTRIDKIVLSHGHVDHTGGLRGLLQERKQQIEVIAHPDVWQYKYSRREDTPDEFIGIPCTREELENKGAIFNMSTVPISITDHIMTTGEVPLITPYETIDEGLFVKENNILVPDKVADDLSLVIDAPYGLVVILGCAHRGIINTLRHAQNITKKEPIYAVIGGTHLIRSSSERLDKTIAELKKFNIKKLGVSHCTGFVASARLAAEFGDAFFLNNAGNQLTLP